MSKKIFTSITLLALFTSFFYLAWLEKAEQDYNYNKNWWAVYFENPKSDNLDFFVENHSNKTNFRYVIFLEKNKISENDFVLQKNEQKRFPVTSNDIKNKKITIQITSENQQKEIYKIIN